MTESMISLDKKVLDKLLVLYFFKYFFIIDLIK